MKLLIFCILVFISGFAYGQTYSSPEALLERYSAEEIKDAFQTPRGISELMESYEERRDGIFIMSTRALYQVRYREGTGLVFETVKTRKEIEDQFPLYVMMWLFIISGGIILLVILVPNKH